jgi:hypothetical protein
VTRAAASLAEREMSESRGLRPRRWRLVKADANHLQRKLSTLIDETLIPGLIIGRALEVPPSDR